jgi:CubicO group peptidase (beta-lactamase class C family)
MKLSNESRAALRRVLVKRQVEGRVPGMFAGVARGGHLVWDDGVGAALLTDPTRPPDADTQFLIASITKTFTAVLVMALRDEGKLSLDDTLEAHLPGRAHGAVTIRQLLAHVSGMQREPTGDVWDNLTFPDDAGLVKEWEDAERILRPHDRWHYSNLGYAMLGKLVATLDGREWSESLRARILGPLEMRRTTLGLVAPHAFGYYVPPFSDVPVAEPVLDTRATAPAGGLASTARDLARWAGFLAAPVGDVLSGDSVEEMCQPQIVADLERWQLAWGLGLELVRSDDQIYVGHTGGMPGHITGVFTHRPTGTAGICLMNATSTPDPAAIAVELAAFVNEHDPEEQQPWRPGSEVPADLVGVLGRWFSEGQAFTFSVRSGTLEARSDAARAHTPPSVFARLADDLYRTASGREKGELLRITRDSGGTPTRLHWATYPFTREPYAFGEWLQQADET